MQLYSCNGSNAQRRQCLPEIARAFSNVIAAFRCLDISNANPAGANVQLWSCDDSVAQRWLKMERRAPEAGTGLVPVGPAMHAQAHAGRKGRP